MAKPGIDLLDSRVQQAIKAYGDRARVAVHAAASRDNAVRPVYALKGHTDKVEQEGSCVLLTAGDQVFALSASHVFEAVGRYALLIGCGTRLHSLAGDRFSSARGPSGTHRDDPIDASVFHITAEIPPEVRASALTVADLDLVVANRAVEFYVASGYRIAKSRSTAKGHTTELERFPTIELDDGHYEHWQVDRNLHLLLAFEDQVLIDMKWQTAPSIRGFSGGAMFRVDEIRTIASSVATPEPRLKLAAIVIERRKGERNKFFSGAVGTRLGVYFGLIHQYLPGLRLDEMLAAEYLRQAKGPVPGIDSM